MGKLSPLPLVTLSVLVCCVVSREMIYQRVFENQGNTVSGSYTELSLYTRTRCGIVCAQSLSCWALSLDDSTGICRIYTFISPTVTLTSAPVSTETYGAIGKYFFVNFQLNVITWVQGAEMCQVAGGTIAYDRDPERMKFLLQWGGVDEAWVGVELNFTDSVWYDYQGVPITPDLWGDTEPWALPYTKAYYRYRSKPSLYSIEDFYTRGRPALCVMEDN